MANDPSDESLAEAIARRGQSDQAWQTARDACEQLYLRHGRLLLAFLSSRVRRSDLEDTHQAVWKLVWQHLPSSFAGGSFRAWLYRIARNLVIDQGRKKRPELFGETEPALPARDGNHTERAEREEILRGCLNGLAPELAELVRARLSGETYDDICRRLDLRPDRAHKLFHQAKAQLQTCVQRAMS
jgi:RNA polymerase sigma factor (sigma-70 family)